MTIESRYFDTADRRLAEAGLSLRLRRTGRLWEQTLKAPGASAVDRAEETVARRGRWTAQGPPIDPALHAQSAAGQKLLALLQDEEGTGAALRSVYETEVSRLRGADRVGRRGRRGRLRSRRDSCRGPVGADLRGRIRARVRLRRGAAARRPGRRRRAPHVPQHGVEGGARRPPGAPSARRAGREGARRRRSMPRWPGRRCCAPSSRPASIRFSATPASWRSGI